MAAPLTVPAVVVDDDDDDQLDCKNVNEALLLNNEAGSGGGSGGGSGVLRDTATQNVNSSPILTINKGHRTFRWWKGGSARHPQPLIQQSPASSNALAKKKHVPPAAVKKSSEARVINHQNNYVSVTVSTSDSNDPAHPILRSSDGRVSPVAAGLPVVANNKSICPPPSTSSSTRRQPQQRKCCWLFFFFLLLVTVACLAFVAVSLVSLLRQGQGKRRKKNYKKKTYVYTHYTKLIDHDGFCRRRDIPAAYNYSFRVDSPSDSFMFTCSLKRYTISPRATILLHHNSRYQRDQ